MEHSPCLEDAQGNSYKVTRTRQGNSYQVTQHTRLCHTTATSYINLPSAIALPSATLPTELPCHSGLPFMLHPFFVLAFPTTCRPRWVVSPMRGSPTSLRVLDFSSLFSPIVTSTPPHWRPPVRCAAGPDLLRAREGDKPPRPAGVLGQGTRTSYERSPRRGGVDGRAYSDHAVSEVSFARLLSLSAACWAQLGPAYQPAVPVFAGPHRKVQWPTQRHI